jgi:hypothetical protein
MLHDKRVASTPWEYQKKYAKGDMVLKLRDDIIKANKLWRYKYLGPYKVTQHEAGSNFVYCTHMSNGKDKVFPIDKIIPFFCDNEEEAKRVSQLDDQSYVMFDVKFHRGDPSKRSSLQFLIRFEDDNEDEYQWYPYSQDIISTDKVIEYCKARPELFILTKTAAEADSFLQQLKKQNVSSAKPGDTVYLDLRSWSYGSTWFDDLKLPESDSKLYLVEAQYEKGRNLRKIDLRAPVLKYMGKDHLFEVDEAYVQQFGSVKSYDPSASFLVDKALVDAYPDLRKDVMPNLVTPSDQHV